jgi:hypothetical protein
MRPRLPDFIIIGAMKSATTTLHEQLARQPGVFMTRPKEPNFFSDDQVYARGIDWYASLFGEAGPGTLSGESSTHYTKLPAYPQTVARMARALPSLKVIYVMRHPIDRLISHYGHEVTDGRTTLGIREAVEHLPGLVDYGRYSMQLEPYLGAFGTGNVLPVFFRRVVQCPQEELERIGRFLGLPGRPTWDTTLRPQNVGSERLRRSALRDALVQAPILTPLRKRLIPKRLTEPIKSLWRSGIEPPPLPPDLMARLRDRFDDDLARLGDWLGVRLDCEVFRQVTQARPLDWVIRH